MDNMRTLELGGLLHDIGRIVQRYSGCADCHGKAGADFIVGNGIMEENNEVVRSIRCQDAAIMELDGLPPDNLAWIISEAACIAAGGSIQKEIPEGREKPLETIFNIVSGIRGNLAYRLQPLREDDGICYPESLQDIAAAGITYEKVYSELLHALKALDLGSVHINAVISIVDQFFSYMPSLASPGDVSDVSLREHARLTAAFASCLYQYLEQCGVAGYQQYFHKNANGSYREDKAFLMVSADISGIQDFIYTISSKGALKSLRARSFYLEIMLEHLADELLDANGLSRANIIYTGGGHFYLLLPNTAHAKETVRQLKEKANDWFLSCYSISLYLEVAWRECSCNDFINPPDISGCRSNRTREVFRDLSKSLSQGKFSRYSLQALQGLFDPSSDINSAGDSGRECIVCHASGRMADDPHNEFPGGICDNCYSLYRSGRNMLRENMMAYVLDTLPESDGLELPSLNVGKCWLFFAGSGETIKPDTSIRRIYTKNTFVSGFPQSIPLWMGDYHLRSENTPGSVMDFSELAGLSQGIDRLAVMRADVDNLGSVFVSGFEQPEGDRFRYSSMARYAALSRNLSVFFKKHINAVCRRQLGSGPDCLSSFSLDAAAPSGDPRKLVIVYSGGDDIFVVGAWDDVVGFAVDLYNSFQKFTAGKLSFSAGIAFFSSGYPISRMAEITEKLEKAAKSLEGKNAVALFGIDDSAGQAGINDNKIRHVHHWNDFIASVCGRKLKMLQDTFSFADEEENHDKLAAGKAFLYRLMELYSGSNPMNLPRLAYMLGRIEPGRSASETLREKYASARKLLYEWALDEKDRNEMLTAINLLVYLYRDKKEA